VWPENRILVHRSLQVVLLAVVVFFVHTQCRRGIVLRLSYPIDIYRAIGPGHIPTLNVLLSVR
jgi:hypothetical protein